MSKQQHYDWGLRAIKTVLSGCQIAMKQYNESQNKSANNISKVEELGIVVSTLRMDIISKLTFSDTIKFNAIIGNIFKDISIENMDNDVLKKALIECYSELKLIVNERQVGTKFIFIIYIMFP